MDKELYGLFLYTTFYDFDTHYNEEVLAVFDTEELAIQAKEKFDNSYTGDGPFVDEWETDIRTIPYNPNWD